ncbi:MAG: hypothetical protein HYV97_15095 [Bdellovibrio sp.]|nr:hypothetical protein [Bdellovibrio sp.]
MKMIITVCSLLFLVASCSCFKHKKDCCAEGPKSCESKCQHQGTDHKCDGHKGEGQHCPMHATPTPTPEPEKK